MWPLYVGGFLGPFGGAMVTPMLPELQHGLHTSLATAAWSLTAYMIPFASIMVVSGTLAERWGRRRTVQLAYAVYALASLVCALAPTAGAFLGGRALQGAANAFTSPLLVAAISDLVPRHELGRALGRYGSMQAAGQAFAPLVGGAAAALDYRLAFGASMIAAVLLAMMPPPDSGRVAATPGQRVPSGAPLPSGAPVPAGAPNPWRALLNPRLVRACVFAFCLYLSTTGLLLLVALLAGDRFGLGPTPRGMVVATFGAAGLLTGAPLGRLADRFGLRSFGAVSMLAFGVAVAASGQVRNLAVLVLVVGIAGAASTSGRVVVNTLAVTSTPANRGGATSITLAWQFLGSALAPLAWLPLYRVDAGRGLLGAATGAFVGVVVLLVARPARRTGVAGTQP